MKATRLDGTVGIAMLGSGFISFFHYLAGHHVNGVRWRAIASRSRNAADQRT